MPRITPIELVHAGSGGVNVCAFLDMLGWGEIGAALLAKSDDGYNVLVGSTAEHPLLFSSYAHHPNVFNKAANSHAAGRYQYMPATWNGLVEKLGFSDFSPINQDWGAVELLRERHAYPQIIAGNIESAIYLAREEWASLPGAGYGQHEQRIKDLLGAFNAAKAKQIMAVWEKQRADFSNVQSGVDR